VELIRDTVSSGLRWLLCKCCRDTTYNIIKVGHVCDGGGGGSAELCSGIMDPSFHLFYLSSFQSGAIDGVVV
jgi:hypothetical protein